MHEFRSARSRHRRPQRQHPTEAAVELQQPFPRVVVPTRSVLDGLRASMLAATALEALVNRTVYVRQDGVFDLWPLGRLRGSCEAPVALPPPLGLPMRVTEHCRIAL